MNTTKLTHVIWLFILVASLGCKNKLEIRGVSDTSDTLLLKAITAPVKLTSGPEQHWFGYYDKRQMDPSGRYVLGMQVDTIYRSPTTQDTLKIGMVDTGDNNKWIELGTSNAWGWQQGCMLQFIPGSAEEIIWNDFQNGNFVSHILNIVTRKKRTLPKPIYALSNDGTFALGTEFNRIQNLRPGYGYPAVEDPYSNSKFPKEIGIYKIHLATGMSQLLLSIEDMATGLNEGNNLKNYWHWFNHLLIAPDDKRFVFLHRWRKEMGTKKERAVGGFTTRMITANVDGSDPYILDPSGNTSHFVWRDSKHLFMWTKPLGKDWGFYVFKDKTQEVSPIAAGIMTQNGHNTYMEGTGKEWVLNDTYPSKEERLQTLYLYHVPTGDTLTLGQFYEPKKFKGEWRCDLHPKSGPEGKKVIFDSTHDGEGRQMYMMDVSEILARE